MHAAGDGKTIRRKAELFILTGCDCMKRRAQAASEGRDPNWSARHRLGPRLSMMQCGG